MADECFQHENHTTLQGEECCLIPEVFATRMCNPKPNRKECLVHNRVLPLRYGKVARARSTAEG